VKHSREKSTALRLSASIWSTVSAPRRERSHSWSSMPQSLFLSDPVGNVQGRRSDRLPAATQAPFPRSAHHPHLGRLCRAQERADSWSRDYFFAILADGWAKITALTFVPIEGSWSPAVVRSRHGRALGAIPRPVCLSGLPSTIQMSSSSARRGRASPSCPFPGWNDTAQRGGQACIAPSLGKPLEEPARAGRGERPVQRRELPGV
jgi:hypothetical protein